MRELASVNNADKDLMGWSAIVWIQCFTLALGMVAANYISAPLGLLIFAIDLALIATAYLTDWRYRWRSTVTLTGVFVMHLAVFFKPDDQPTVSLPIAIIAMMIWIISLFIPRSSPRT